MNNLVFSLLAVLVGLHTLYTFAMVQITHRIALGLAQNDQRLFAYFDQAEGEIDPAWYNLLLEQSAACIVFKLGMLRKIAPIVQLRLATVQESNAEEFPIGMASHLACVNVFYGFLKYPRLAWKHRPLAKVVLHRLWTMDNTSAESVTDLARMIEAFNADIVPATVTA